MGTISTILVLRKSAKNYLYIVILYTLSKNCKNNIIQGCVKFYLGTSTETKKLYKYGIMEITEHNELNRRSTFTKFGIFIQMLINKS